MDPSAISLCLAKNLRKRGHPRFPLSRHPHHPGFPMTQRRAVRWIRPTGTSFSLRFVMLVVALIAVYIALFNAHYLMGVGGLIYTTYVLLLISLGGVRL